MTKGERRNRSPLPFLGTGAGRQTMVLWPPASGCLNFGEGGVVQPRAGRVPLAAWPAAHAAASPILQPIFGAVDHLDRMRFAALRGDRLGAGQAAKPTEAGPVILEMAFMAMALLAFGVAVAGNGLHPALRGGLFLVWRVPAIALIFRSVWKPRQRLKSLWPATLDGLIVSGGGEVSRTATGGKARTAAQAAAPPLLSGGHAASGFRK